MITISLCMIVKNEEAVLARCLDSIAPLMDEIIIIDTGSTDRTREIAHRYTDQVYDFEWCDDFSAARNFSFSKASMDYIYAPDADEYLDSENQERFRRLKEVLLPEIEIVQMYYLTPDHHNTVQNYGRELRPKLFRRLRTFTWIDPIHETVRLEPVVYDSDIEIQHLPLSSHERRDFSVFRKALERDGALSERIMTMYAKELLKCGTTEDFSEAAACFEELYRSGITPESTCVLARYYRLAGDDGRFFSVALKNFAVSPCSEVCCELGSYYRDHKDWEEAILWYQNAAFETEAVLDIESGSRIPLREMANCYECWCDSLLAAHTRDITDQSIQSLRESAEKYRSMAENWTMPQDD